MTLLPTASQIDGNHPSGLDWTTEVCHSSIKFTSEGTQVMQIGKEIPISFGNKGNEVQMHEVMSWLLEPLSNERKEIEKLVIKNGGKYSAELTKRTTLDYSNFQVYLLLFPGILPEKRARSYLFGNSPHIPGLAFPVQELFLEDVLEKTRSVYKSYNPNTRQSLEDWSRSDAYMGLVEATIEYICRHEGPGAILVFLTGWDKISKLLDNVKANNFLNNPSKFLVPPLHGSMPTINQREIFDCPPSGTRKVVLATSIAESSITVYFVDCRKAKETSYDALNKLACLLPSWISKASSHQVLLRSFF
ncbi:hypothetical protein LXL04_021290 [Taraxacum kok-saghyz]